MKHKLFKKFAQVDFNTYHYAIINGDIYYAVSTDYYYKTHLLGIIPVTRFEEESFVSVKIPNAILSFLTDYDNAVKNETVDTFSFDDSREHLASEMRRVVTAQHDETMSKDMVAEEFHFKRSLFAKMYDNIDAMFYNDWNNAIIPELTSNGYTFVLCEYTGVATRNLWFASYVDDLVSFVQVKLLGKADRNTLVDYKRVLMSDEILSGFLSNIANSMAQGEN